MKIICPQCKMPIKASDLNMTAGVAACKSCDIGFYLNQKQTSFKKPQVGENHSLKIKRNGLGVLIEHNWRNNGGLWFFIIFTVFWNGIVFLVFGAGGSQLIEQVKKEPALLVFLAHPTVGIVMGYITLCKLINKTTLLIEKGQVWVKHGPLWWPGNKKISSHEISQAYVEKYVGYRQNNHPVYRYKIKVISNGIHEGLLKGLASYNDALKIEQLLEEHLSIIDHSVENEHVGKVS